MSFEFKPLPKRINSIICHQNGITYKNPAVAARALGVRPAQIYQYLSRRRVSAINGYTFEYTDKDKRTPEGRRLRDA